MNEDENFESLRRLLSLKRHEVPPPGYFHNFSSQVVNRIRRDAQESAHATSWLTQFIKLFETKPALAGAFACALCLLLVFGIVNAERPDLQGSAPDQPFASTAENSTPIATVSPLSLPQSSSQPMVALNSTNPVLSLQPTIQPSVNALFGQPAPMVQDVSFTPPGASEQ